MSLDRQFKELFQELFDNQTDILMKRIKEELGGGIKEEAEVCEWQYEKNQFENKIIQLENQIKKTEEENNVLKQEYDKKIQELNKVKEDFSISEEENKVLQEEHKTLQENYYEKEKEADNLRADLNKYEDKYGEVNIMLEKLFSISDKNRLRLRNIFSENSLYSFIAAGSDLKNIEGLWMFTQRRIIEQEMDDVESLTDLISFMIEVYNSCQVESKIEKVSLEVGKKFDSDLCNIIGTETDGYIKEVKLFGLKNKKTEKIIQKALVKV